MYKLSFLLVTIAISSVLSDPRPDLTVPATISGVSSGSSGTYGNIVANVDRIQYLLNQFHSIVESLYYVESPELNSAAENFRYVMDSLVEIGSPIFQSLANVAKVSSGNVSKIFDGIRDDIKTAADENEEHLLLVNQTNVILGNNNTAYFEGVLNQLTANLGNISTYLDNIQKAIIEIDRLNPKTQESIKALLPNDDIKGLNAVLRQYILIGDAAVPMIRTVVSRVRSVDTFLVRIRNGYDQQRRSLNTTLATTIKTYIDTYFSSRLRTTLTAISNQVVSSTSSTGVSLGTLMTDSNDALRIAANKTMVSIQQLSQDVTMRINSLLINTIASPSDIDLLDQIFNFTESRLVEVSKEMSLAMTQVNSSSDTCFARYNYEFDKIPRTLYNQLYTCEWDRANYLSEVSLAIGSVANLPRSTLNYAFTTIQRCTSLITRYSNEMTKYQAASCLTRASMLSNLYEIYQTQLRSYQMVVTYELDNSNTRHRICLYTSLSQALAQIDYLRYAINSCLNGTPIKIPSTLTD